MKKLFLTLAVSAMFCGSAFAETGPTTTAISVDCAKIAKEAKAKRDAAAAASGTTATPDSTESAQ